MTAMVYPWQTAATLDPNLKCTSVMLLPRATDSSERSRLPRRVRSLRDWWLWPNLESVVLAFMVMIVPEMYACNALGSRLSASAYKKEFEKLPPHCHPAHGWTLTHTFFANMGGFAVYSDAASLHPYVTHLTAKSLLQLMQDHGQCISAQALSSEEDIQDRSKRNALSKILVLTQISWFLLNCITRLIKGLPTTQLEMGIMGTAVCSMVSYLVLFDQPYSVKSAIPVLSFDGDMPTHVAKIVESDSDLRGEDGRIKNFSQFDLPDGQQPSLTLMGVVFTALVTSMAAFHLGAWNFAFPTETDKWVWRISSITTCSFVPALGVFVLILFGPLLALKRIELAITISKMENNRTKGFFGAPMSLLLFAYWAARVVLAVEMIRFLFYIPPGALLTSWADNLPHI